LSLAGSVNSSAKVSPLYKEPERKERPEYQHAQECRGSIADDFAHPALANRCASSRRANRPMIDPRSLTANQPHGEPAQFSGSTISRLPADGPIRRGVAASATVQGPIRSVCGNAIVPGNRSICRTSFVCLTRGGAGRFRLGGKSLICPLPYGGAEAHCNAPGQLANRDPRTLVASAFHASYNGADGRQWRLCKTEQIRP
jgi:hypothetical protein